MKRIARNVFQAAVAYEVVKMLQLIVGAASQVEIYEQNESRKIDENRNKDMLVLK